MSSYQLHSLHRRLFYLPIIWAAFNLGLRGSVITALISSFIYAPHLLLKMGAIPFEALDSFYELVMFNLVGWVTGVLVEKANKARHQAEDAKQKLAQSNFHLQQRNLEMHSLAEQVRRSERMNALGQLVAGLAHEIRNPLGIINATAQLLSDEIEADSEMREGLGIIRDEAQRLNRTLNIFLDFARPRPVHHRTVRLETMMDDLLLMFRKLLSQHAIVLQPHLDPAAREMTVDPDLLKQVLVNLILNAIQAMPHGGQLDFTVRPVPGGTEFTISDTGTGIGPENLGRIFDPFFTTKETGTGIGLSVVHRLVDDMEGSITVASEVGKGSTFTVYLPLTLHGGENDGQENPDS